MNKIIKYLCLFLMIIISIISIFERESKDIVSVVPLMILLSCLYLRFSCLKEDNKNEKNN